VHDVAEFGSLGAYQSHTKLNGYYGGMRILRATVGSPRAFKPSFDT